MEIPKRPIDAATQVYGIFGSPVRHSLSPLIHNSEFKRLQINALYLAFEVSPFSLGLAFEGIRSLGIRGVNLTIPHKENALNFIDEIPEDMDRCVGALNTVVNRGGKLYGHNTDVPGFLLALKKDLSFNPEGKNVLVLGAGGAARGVVSALARARSERIFVHNRTPRRAEGLRDTLGVFFPETELETVADLRVLEDEKIDLVVNATSLGMKENDALPFDLRTLSKEARVYDLVVSTRLSPFLEEAKKLGFPYANGTGMLAAQAALSFELWTGQKKGVRESMLETLKQCHL